MNRSLSFLLLSFITLLLVAQPHDNKYIKTSRTTCYQAIAQDTTYTTGAITSNFYFTRYDDLGRIWIERQVNQAGETVSQVQHVYNDDSRVIRQIYSAQKNPFRDYRYGYDAEGRLNDVTCLDSVGNILNQKTLFYRPDGKNEMLIQEFKIENSKGEAGNDTQKYIDIYVYNDEGELINVIEENLLKGVTKKLTRNPEKKDKRPLRLQSDIATLDMGLMKEKTVVIDSNNGLQAEIIQEHTLEFEYDCYDNWVKRVELINGVPQFISMRTIDYDTLTSSRQQLDLQHKVKSVKQSSYKAIHKGPGSIDKGAKQGLFFVYEFDADGRKIKEKHYSEKGVKLGSTQYVYNDNDQIVKELRKDANGALLQSVDWNYDKQGLLKSKQLKTADGTTTHKGIFHYDILKNCVAQIWYAKDGTKCAEMAYLYDGFGLLIEEKVILKPEEGLGLEFNNVKRKWNSRGRAVEELVEHENGETMLLTYKYNKNGKHIGGSETVNSNPTVDYVYKFYNDQYGNWKKKVKFVNDISTVYEEREYVYYN